LLGYIEYDQLKSPKALVLNEMIELAKRYWDEASPKLINAIGDNLLN
jgi:transcription termination factor NusB